MARKFTLICLFVLSFFPTLFAKELKPLDAFIERVKSTNKFVPVSDIWQADNAFDQRDLLKKVERAQPMTIDYAKVAALMDKKTMAISLTVPGINGGSYTLELARYDFFTNDFTVHAVGANNEDKIVDYTPGLYYSGVVKGIEGSMAVFSFFKGEVYGIFSIPGERGNFVLAPNTMTDNNDYNSHYILYNDVDILIRDRAPKCGTELLPELDQNLHAAKTTTTFNNNVFSNCGYIRCYEVADYKLYQFKSSNVTTTTNYITAIFNAKAALYRNEDVPIALKKIQVNTASDPYVGLPTAADSIGVWLRKFGSVVQNDIHTVHGCDVATLFTRQTSGGMGGVAWVGATCSNYNSSSKSGPYCFLNVQNDIASKPFPLYSWDAGSSAHEMGHSLGSRHTHACLWNPPFTGSTAIDGCYTLEPNATACANPGIPTSAVGGTIMSYCHLTSAGVKFANGFGPQPGTVIRKFVSDNFSPTSCGEVYIPTKTMTKANRTLTANRQCTNISGGDTTTYYWYDNSSASVDDDTLILAAKLHGNNFGTLNTSGLSIKMTTFTAYGTNVGQSVTFPSGLGLRPNQKAFNRYWQVAGATAATGLVEVMYPFTATDISDVDGSIPGTTAIPDFRMYKTVTSLDPNPSVGFSSATPSNISIFNYSATAPSTTQWYQSTPSSTLKFAHMKMKDLNGGGTGFYDYTVAAVSLSDVAGNTLIAIYPNPTDNEWQVAVSNNVNGLTFRLYAADGRLVVSKDLTAGVNTVSAAGLATGVYFYRIVGDDNAYTGSLMKK